MEKTGIYEVNLGASFYVMKWRFIKGVNPACFIVGNLKGDKNMKAANSSSARHGFSMWLGAEVRGFNKLWAGF